MASILGNKMECFYGDLVHFNVFDDFSHHREICNILGERDKGEINFSAFCSSKGEVLCSSENGWINLMSSLRTVSDPLFVTSVVNHVHKHGIMHHLNFSYVRGFGRFLQLICVDESLAGKNICLSLSLQGVFKSLKIVDDVFSFVSAIPSHFSQLRSLNLSGNKLTDESLCSILEPFAEMNCLMALDISTHKLTLNVCGILIKWLNKDRELASATGTSHIVTSKCSLRDLSLYNCCLGSGIPVSYEVVELFHEGMLPALTRHAFNLTQAPCPIRCSCSSCKHPNSKDLTFSLNLGKMNTLNLYRVLLHFLQDAATCCHECEMRPNQGLELSLNMSTFDQQSAYLLGVLSTGTPHVIGLSLVDCQFADVLDCFTDGAGWCINQRSRMERAENKNKAMKKRVVIEVQLDVWCVLLRTIVHKFEADQSDAQATTTGWPLQAVCTYPGCSWLGLGFQFANLAKLLQDYNDCDEGEGANQCSAAYVRVCKCLCDYEDMRRSCVTGGFGKDRCRDGRHTSSTYEDSSLCLKRICSLLQKEERLCAINNRVDASNSNSSEYVNEVLVDMLKVELSQHTDKAEQPPSSATTTATDTSVLRGNRTDQPRMKRFTLDLSTNGITEVLPLRVLFPDFDVDDVDTTQHCMSVECCQLNLSHNRPTAQSLTALFQCSIIKSTVLTSLDLSHCGSAPENPGQNGSEYPGQSNTFVESDSSASAAVSSASVSAHPSTSLAGPLTTPIRSLKVARCYLGMRGVEPLVTFLCEEANAVMAMQGRCSSVRAGGTRQRAVSCSQWGVVEVDMRGNDDSAVTRRRHEDVNDRQYSSLSHLTVDFPALALDSKWQAMCHHEGVVKGLSRVITHLFPAAHTSYTLIHCLRKHSVAVNIPTELHMEILSYLMAPIRQEIDWS